MNHLYANIVQ